MARKYCIMRAVKRVTVFCKWSVMLIHIPSVWFPLNCIHFLKLLMNIHLIWDLDIFGSTQKTEVPAQQGCCIFPIEEYYSKITAIRNDSNINRLIRF